ncbi:MAG TPA: hemerythrin domain-containing protein [Steroidobacteraceae bacterium]|jgi:hemerythrin superfamily protein
MTMLDKVIAAVSPTESPQARQTARSRALQMSGSDDWLSTVLAQHLSIERAFEAAMAAPSPEGRHTARRKLGELLTAHTMAEEAAIYPALARAGEKSHASKAFSEQADAKLAFGLLEALDPMSQEYIEKLEELDKAVRHHVYEEEGKWFIDLKQRLPQTDQDRLTQRFHDEYSRYKPTNDAATEQVGGLIAAAKLQTHSSH